MIIKRQKAYSRKATKLVNKAIRKKFGFDKNLPMKSDPLQKFTGEYGLGELVTKRKKGHTWPEDKFVSGKKAARDIKSGRYKGNIALYDGEGIADVTKAPKELMNLHDHPNRFKERFKDEHEEISRQLRKQLFEKKYKK